MADRPTPTVTLVLDENGHVTIDGAGTRDARVPARTVMLSAHRGVAIPAGWDVPAEALEVLAALVRDISGWGF